MPVQMCRNRPHCPNLVERGYCEGCSAKGLGKDTRPTAAQRGYDGKWARYSKGFVRGKLCADPYGSHGARRGAATLTDHRIPWRVWVEGVWVLDWKLFWDAANHQALCSSCAGRKTALEDGGFGRARGAR